MRKKGLPEVIVIAMMSFHKRKAKIKMRLQLSEDILNANWCTSKICVSVTDFRNCTRCNNG